MKKLFIDYHPKRVCVAMTENNELKEYYVEKATKPKIVGNIYKGKVVNTLQGMKAAFVNIGLEKKRFPLRRRNACRQDHFGRRRARYAAKTQRVAGRPHYVSGRQGLFRHERRQDFAKHIVAGQARGHYAADGLRRHIS